MTNFGEVAYLDSDHGTGAGSLEEATFVVNEFIGISVTRLSTRPMSAPVPSLSACAARLQ